MLLFKMVFGDISPYGFYSEGTSPDWIADNAPLLDLEEIVQNPCKMTDEQKSQLSIFYDFVRKLLEKNPEFRLYNYEDIIA